MLENIKKYIRENISILIVLICFLFISVFNAYMNIGLIEDGNHHFWEALISENVLVGHEGIEQFPYNSRYFPSIVQHLSVGIPIILGLTNLKMLVHIFTFVSYFLPILILLIIYLNIPKIKRDSFEIILLYFLTCMNFLIYQIWTENFLTGLFLWVIFVIYYYIDFDKLSKFNLVSLIVFSVCLISSHPMTAAFVVPMIIFAIIKHFKTKTISKLTSIILILSYILLFITFIFNLYFIIKPIYPKDDYLLFTFFKSPAFKYFFISIIFVLTISFIKNNDKLKYVFYFLFGLVCIGMLNFVLLEINSSDGYMYRVLGFYVPLVLMLFVLFKDFFKFIMNYKYIKIINILLVFIFAFHSIYYGISWNKYLFNVKNIMETQKQVNFIQLSKYELFHFHTLPYDFIFIPTIFNVKSNCKIILSNENFLSGHVKKIQRYENKLSKFDIDVNNFIIN